MSKRSKKYAAQMAEKWKQYDDGNTRVGLPLHSLEHKLSIAWRQGFDAGQRHQRKLAKEKIPQPS